MPALTPFYSAQYVHELDAYVRVVHECLVVRGSFNSIMETEYDTALQIELDPLDVERKKLVEDKDG